MKSFLALVLTVFALQAFAQAPEGSAGTADEGPGAMTEPTPTQAKSVKPAKKKKATKKKATKKTHKKAKKHKKKKVTQ
ncbi:MAG: hypothetical protein ACXWQQ_12405 [Pseudobdellovibrio sp.]